MQITGDEIVRYPYTLADLEKIKPSQVRVGDLLASAGPVDSDRYRAYRVTWHQIGERSETFRCDTWCIATEAMRPEHYLHQPETFLVRIVRRDQNQGATP